MLPIAHTASAMLVNRALGLDGSLRTASLGALTPDIIDKSLSWVFHITPTGRHLGHAPLTAAAVALAVGAVAGRRLAMSVGAGYLAHLVGDLWRGGHVPWLMPAKRYDVASPRWTADLSPEALLLEAAGIAVIALLIRRDAP